MNFCTRLLALFISLHLFCIFCCSFYVWFCLGVFFAFLSGHLWDQERENNFKETQHNYKETGNIYIEMQTTSKRHIMTSRGAKQLEIEDKIALKWLKITTVSHKTTWKIHRMPTKRQLQRNNKMTSNRHKITTKRQKTSTKGCKQLQRGSDRLQRHKTA